MMNIIPLKTSPLLAPAVKIACIAAVTIAGFATTSCMSQNEKDFEAQNGFKRSDYFGDENRKYIPPAARKHGYVKSDESTVGVPMK